LVQTPSSASRIELVAAFLLTCPVDAPRAGHEKSTYTTYPSASIQRDNLFRVLAHNIRGHFRVRRAAGRINPEGAKLSHSHRFYLNPAEKNGVGRVAC
jgi:hypothetical protein